MRKYVEDFTNGEVKGQTGSLTALPVIETQGRRRICFRTDERYFYHRRSDLLGSRLCLTQVYVLR